MTFSSHVSWMKTDDRVLFSLNGKRIDRIVWIVVFILGLCMLYWAFDVCKDVFGVGDVPETVYCSLQEADDVVFWLTFFFQVCHDLLWVVSIHYR